MDFLGQQNSLQLDILKSLARSQRALTVMIEAVSSITVKVVPLQGFRSNLDASLELRQQELKQEQILKHLESLSQYQLALTQRISGIQIRHVKQGRPTKPWLASRINSVAGVSQ